MVSRFDPRQPRDARGEWTGGNSRTHANSPHATGSFKTYPKSAPAAPAAAAPAKPSTPSTRAVIRRADRLQANGNSKKAEQILQEHRQKLVGEKPPTMAEVQKARAANEKALQENRAKLDAVKARRAESKAKIARSNYIIKNGLAGADDATIDAHMRAHGKK